MDTMEAVKHTDGALYHSLNGVINMFKDAKPDERSERSRGFAVTITELEKALAYFVTYVYRTEEPYVHGVE